MERKPCAPSFVMAGFFGCLLLLFLTNLSFAADATLGWDPNSEADLSGYGAYYFRLDDPSAAYKLFGYVALDELADAGSPTITVTGLDSGARYQFAATAYDTAGRESGFSVPVCAETGVANVAIVCPVSDDSGGSGGGGSGGGGGGGCFIRSVFGEKDEVAGGLVGILLIWSFVSLRSLKNKTR